MSISSLGSSLVSGAESSVGTETDVLQRELEIALLELEEELEHAAADMASLEIILEPIFEAAYSAQVMASVSSDIEMLARRHVNLVEGYEGVQWDADRLKEEIREDGYLDGFRNVSEQAAGMMRSLEKALDQCQVSLDPFNVVRHPLITFCRTLSGVWTQTVTNAQRDWTSLRLSPFPSLFKQRRRIMFQVFSR